MSFWKAASPIPIATSGEKAGKLSSPWAFGASRGPCLFGGMYVGLERWWHLLEGLLSQERRKLWLWASCVLFHGPPRWTCDCQCCLGPTGARPCLPASRHRPTSLPYHCLFQAQINFSIKSLLVSCPKALQPPADGVHSGSVSTAICPVKGTGHCARWAPASLESVFVCLFLASSLYLWNLCFSSCVFILTFGLI